MQVVALPPSLGGRADGEITHAGGRGLGGLGERLGGRGRGDNGGGEVETESRVLARHRATGATQRRCRPAVGARKLLAVETRCRRRDHASRTGGAAAADVLLVGKGVGGRGAVGVAGGEGEASGAGCGRDGERRCRRSSKASDGKRRESVGKLGLVNLHLLRTQVEVPDTRGQWWRSPGIVDDNRRLKVHVEWAGVLVFQVKSRVLEW